MSFDPVMAVIHPKKKTPDAARVAEAMAQHEILVKEKEAEQKRLEAEEQKKAQRASSIASMYQADRKIRMPVNRLSGY